MVCCQDGAAGSCPLLPSNAGILPAARAAGRQGIPIVWPRYCNAVLVNAVWGLVVQTITVSVQKHSLKGPSLRLDGQVAVQDTVGCGDAFAAGITLGYTQQQSLAGTMALANAVGAATAMGTGAGRNVATADTVLDLLTAQVGTLDEVCRCIIKHASDRHAN